MFASALENALCHSGDICADGASVDSFGNGEAARAANQNCIARVRVCCGVSCLFGRGRHGGAARRTVHQCVPGTFPF